MKEMDVVIVSYAKNRTCWNLTFETINSLFSSEKDWKFNVFVVESEPDCDWSQIFQNTQTIFTDGKYGYHKYLNLGRKAGSAEWVALCNNDLVFRPGWARKIDQAWEYNQSYLSFSPICPFTQPQYGIKLNTGLIKGYDIRLHVSGWCIVQRREIYDKIGDLDENFTHWFCDNDYAMTLQFSGVNHMLVTTSVVEHHANTLGKTTTETVKDPEKLREMTIGSKIIFDNKWGR